MRNSLPALLSLALIPAASVGQVSIPKGNIVQVLNKDKRFTLYRKMLKTTGMETFLSTTHPYTVFAPTNDAFKKLPKSVIKAITETDAYGSQVAAASAVKGKYGLISFTNGVSPTGQPLTYKFMSHSETFITTISDKNGVTANGVKIIGEIHATNGTILIVDSILPVVMPAPAPSGLSPAINPLLLKYGLGHYVLPARKSNGISR